MNAETLRKWQTIADQGRRNFILKSTTLVQQNTDQTYILKQRDDGNCIHSGNTGLCTIQSDLGHDYLPATCQEYPRAIINKHNITLETAHISCPAITALLTDIEITQLINDESGLYTGMDESIINRFSIILHDYKQRLFSDPSLPNGLILYLISQLLSTAMKMAAAGNLNIDSLDDSHQQAIINIEKYRFEDASYTPGNFSNENKHGITDFLQTLTNGPIRKYLTELSRKFTVPINAISLDDLAYLHSGPFSPGTNNLLRNYLYLKFINHGFPWNPTLNNHTASFLNCVFPYIICHVLMVAYIRTGIEINVEILQKIIYSVEKLNAHNFDNFKLIGKNQKLLNLDNYNELFTLLI